MLNLLVLDHDYTHAFYKSYHYLWEEVKKITNCVIVHPHTYNLVEIIEQAPFKPDFILINEFIKGWLVQGCQSVNIPIGYMPHDVDSLLDIRRKFFTANNISLIFSIIKHSFLKNYPDFSDKLRWLPHHVNTHVFKDYHLKKQIDALLIGRTNPSLYPLRNKIVRKLNGHRGFLYPPHPDEHNLPYTLIGEIYAKEINKAKLFFTCCSTLKYPILKYYEVLACRTLLLADSCPELEELGFKPGEHFIKINKKNFHEKARYYLKNKKERNRIAKNGYRFVRNNHSTKIRAKQLVKYIIDFLN